MTLQLPMELIAELTSSDSVIFREKIQSLWSGYGVIAKVDLVSGCDISTPAVVKFVSPPSHREHKYGWRGDVSHQRKLSSYQNEFLWYEQVALSCLPGCRVPQLLAANQQSPRWLFVLEDLDAAGFSLRLRSVNDHQLESCLGWLAHLHASFLVDREADDADEAASNATAVERLWPTGTYWHLDTRPEEFSSMPESDLKSAAKGIDRALKAARFQTLVHGDAKIANFCVSPDGRVAAVDFQYVGRGCGMKDVAYFVSSCFSESECERREGEILERYFGLLGRAVQKRGLQISWKSLESEWRMMYVLAWADFYRFLAGWSPGHWKMHGYSQRMAKLACQGMLPG